MNPACSKYYFDNSWHYFDKSQPSARGNLPKLLYLGLLDDLAVDDANMLNSNSEVTCENLSSQSTAWSTAK